MIAVVFTGSIDDLKQAEAWCRHGADHRYFKDKTGTDQFRFTFQNPFDAQAFTDAHPDHTYQIYE